MEIDRSSRSFVITPERSIDINGKPETVFEFPAIPVVKSFDADPENDGRRVEVVPETPPATETQTTPDFQREPEIIDVSEMSEGEFELQLLKHGPKVVTMDSLRAPESDKLPEEFAPSPFAQAREMMQ